MSTSTTSLTVVYVGQEASVFITLPPAAGMSGEHVVEYEVTGPRPIVNFPGVHPVGDFEKWREAKERDGFSFSNPKVVTG